MITNRFFARIFVVSVLMLTGLVHNATAHPSGGKGDPFGYSDATGSVPVSGYMKSNGTYVQPYFRSAPDGNFYNNWSTSGNSNPYTGQAGTRVTPPGQSYAMPFYALSPQDQTKYVMDSWIGAPSNALGAIWGKPYKTHKQKDKDWSAEYVTGFGSMRAEFFFHEDNNIYKWKIWGYM